MKVQADIITIGDEILIGQIVDTNSAWMGKELNKIGISIRQILSISDSKDAIISGIKNSMQYSDIVFITGGLGPTNDDITKHTLCELFDSKLIIHEEALKNVEHFVALRNGEMNKNNCDQALFPDKAEFIPNLNGTASGIWFNAHGKIVISMPGVPHEMTKMMQEQILPKLKAKFKLPAILHKTVIVTNISESKLAEILTDWEAQLNKSIKLAYLPSPGLIRLRLSISGDTATEIENIVAEEIAKLKHIIPQYISGYEDISLEELLGRKLKQRSKTIATAESCTGGLIASKITTIPGASTYYKGSIIAYDNAIKQNLLNVPAETIEKYGAVSEEVVKIMAQNICSIFKTDIGIAVSGIAGPDGGTKEKQVGTVWIAINNNNTITTKCYSFGNERERNILRAANAAITMVISEL